MSRFPNDPTMMMSVINMMLRDQYANLDALCDDLDEDRSEIEAKLAKGGYSYDENSNRFM